MAEGASPAGGSPSDIEGDGFHDDVQQEGGAEKKSAWAPKGARTRRCIVTGEVLPEDRLIRFVAGPEGVVVPDLARKLPGRGLWVRAARADVELAARKGAFSRAAKAQLKAPPDLADQVESLLKRRLLQALGLARRRGADPALGLDHHGLGAAVAEALPHGASADRTGAWLQRQGSPSPSAAALPA